MPKRNTFSRESKLEAIRLLETGDKKVTDLARELGVPRNKLHKWREEHALGQILHHRTIMQDLTCV